MTAIFLLAALVFLSPLMLVWTASGSPWFAPYALWAVVIALVAAVQRLRGRTPGVT